jgi:hypothetical protein
MALQDMSDRRGRDSNPRYRFDPVRRFSKPLLSAAQPPLQTVVFVAARQRRAGAATYRTHRTVTADSRAVKEHHRPARRGPTAPGGRVWQPSCERSHVRDTTAHPGASAMPGNCRRSAAPQSCLSPARGLPPQDTSTDPGLSREHCSPVSLRILPHDGDQPLVGLQRRVGIRRALH